MINLLLLVQARVNHWRIGGQAEEGSDSEAGVGEDQEENWDRTQWCQGSTQWEETTGRAFIGLL